MPSDPEILRNQPHKPQDQLQKLAAELLAMPTDNGTFENELRGVHVNFFKDPYDADKQRMMFDQHDLYDRAKEVVDALDKLRSGRAVEVDKPLYPEDLHYRLTVREALAQGAEVIKGFLHFESTYASQGAEDVKDPTFNAAMIKAWRSKNERPLRDPDDPDLIDDARSMGASQWRSGNQGVKKLLPVQAKFDELLAALPPKRRLV